MLISKNWLTRLLQGAGNEGWTVTDEELDAGFVRVGFETEGYAPIEETTGPLVLGRVAEIEELTGFKKPIRYCQVDVGQANGTGELQGIICGARNFALGDYVVVSLPGAVLPGGFEIAARKTYDHISNGMMADFALVAAITDPSKGRAGVSMFIVDADLEGFTKAGPLQKVGLKAQDTAELNFDNVRVPAENLLGEEGAAFGYLRTNLAHERLTLACGSVATSRRAWTLAYKYAQEREAFGRPIIQHQVHGHYLADIATRVTALQAFVDQAVMAHNAGQLDETGASMAKYWTTEEQQDIVTRCLQMFGGYGFMLEYPISTHYLDSKVQTIYGGTNEIMKEIIFRRIAKGGAE